MLLELDALPLNHLYMMSIYLIQSCISLKTQLAEYRVNTYKYSYHKNTKANH